MTFFRFIDIANIKDKLQEMFLFFPKANRAYVIIQVTFLVKKECSGIK
jgi:hypothetical protein